jgi:hypothetical protein
MSKEITRRRFLVLGGGAGLSAFLGGAYVVSACPLTDTGICVGPCAAYIDQRGDGLCDRAYADRSAAQAVAQGTQDVGQASLPDSEGARQAAPAPSTPHPRAGVACPYGLVNDPYPGQCRRYVDQNGDGICDLSKPGNGLTAPESGTQIDEGRRSRRRGWGNGRQ